MANRHLFAVLSIALVLWLPASTSRPLLAQSAGERPTPDINCDKPKTRVEQTVCGDSALQSMGLSISQLYISTLTLADSPAAEAQRRFRWLQSLNDCNKQRGESLRTCVQSSYEARVRDLEALATDLRARAEERRATADRAAAAAQAARDFADQEAERRRVELAAQEAAAAQSAQDSRPRASGSPPAQQEEQYRTEETSTEMRGREDAFPQTSRRAAVPEPMPPSMATGEQIAPSPSPNGDTDIGKLFLVLACLALAPFVYGASGGVSFCHQRGFVVYSARRYLLLWSWGAVGILAMVAYLVDPAISGSAVFAIGVPLWWVVQCFRAKVLNPTASHTEIAVITLARASSAALFAVLAWGIFGNAKRATSSRHGLSDQLAGALNVLILVTFAALYGNFVCYPRFDKYPQSAYALAAVS